MPRHLILRSFIPATICLAAAAAFAGPPRTEVISLDKLGIPALTLTSTFDGPHSAVERPKTGGVPAYNYSVHLLYDAQARLYRLYVGGRWKSPLGDGDHIFQYTSATGRGGTWKPHAGSADVPRGHEPTPQFLQGKEEKLHGKWFSGNCMDPEVMKVDGIFYLYTQVEIGKGQTLDTGEPAAHQADRIQLHTSKDGVEWKRVSKDLGVIRNVTDPTKTSFDHQEMLYVPWDADKRPFWMYVHVTVGGKALGHVLMRSADPAAFDWTARQHVAGFSQLGNQVAYIREAPGGPLFLRITFTTVAERKVPTLQFSHDGLQWFHPKAADETQPPHLAGSEDNDKYRNTYFLGLSTIDGTGQIPSAGAGRYHFIYGATTCNKPVQPDIWHSAIGVGEVEMTFGEAAAGKK